MPDADPLNTQFARRAVFHVAFCEDDDERLSALYCLSTLGSEEVDSTEVDVVSSHWSVS